MVRIAPTHKYHYKCWAKGTYLKYKELNGKSKVKRWWIILSWFSRIMKEVSFKTRINKKIAIIFFISTLLFIVFYVGYSDGEVVFSDMWIGTTSNGSVVDYVFFVDYTSRGAFVAGEDIHVDAKLYLLSDEFMNSTHQFSVIFENSRLKSMQKKGDYPITGYIDMPCVNTNIAVGSVDLYYPNSGEYRYYFIVDRGIENAQFIFINSTSTLHVAPLETRLQIKNNDIMLKLTLVIIIFTLVQIFLPYFKKIE